MDIYYIPLNKGNYKLYNTIFIFFNIILNIKHPKTNYYLYTLIIILNIIFNIKHPKTNYYLYTLYLF